MNSKPSKVLDLLRFAALAAGVALAGCSAETNGGGDIDDDSNPPADQVEDDGPPANWTKLYTSTTPTNLSITANSSSSGGTTNSITLAYWSKAGEYSCTLDSVTKGETRSCTPTRTGDWTFASKFGYDKFRVYYTDTGAATDGLLITAIGVTMDGVNYTMSKFDPNAGLDCTGCDWMGFNCNSCWIDSDDHDKCTHMAIPMSTSENADCDSD